MKALRFRILLLAAGTVVLAVLGLIYAWSLFVEPLEAEFGWSRGQTSFTFSLSMIAWSCGMLANGWLSKRLAARACFAVGACLIAGGFFGCSFVGSLGQLYVCYGVCCGFGIGLCYNLWTATVLAWFPDRVGFASGLLLMGFGMGSMVFGSAAAALMGSPVGWRGAFVILAGIMALVAAVALPLLRLPSANDCGELARLAERRAAKRPAARDTPVPKEASCNLSGVQMLREPSFWTFTAWKVLAMGGAAALIAQASVVMTGLGATAVFATATVGMLSVGNGLGRPLVGALYDRIGRDRTLVVLPAAGLIVALGMLASYASGAVALLAVLLLLEGVLYGGYAAVNTSFVRTTYGQRSLATNLGISSFTLMPFNLVFPLAAAFAFEAAGSYEPFFAALPLVALVSLLAGIVTKPAIARMHRRAR